MSANHTTMNISLPPALRAHVELMVSTGRYPSASAVIQEALRQHIDSLNALMAKLPPIDEAALAAFRDRFPDLSKSNLEKYGTEDPAEILEIMKERRAEKKARKEVWPYNIKENDDQNGG